MHDDYQPSSPNFQIIVVNLCKYTTSYLMVTERRARVYFSNFIILSVTLFFREISDNWVLLCSS